MMRPSPSEERVSFTKSLSGRFTLAAIALALAVFATLAFATEWYVREASDKALAQAVDTDLAGLVDIYASSGRQELLDRIEDRLAMEAYDQADRHYLVADATGQRVGGDIARWPNLSAENSASGTIVLEDGSEARARATQLDQGLTLVVAHGADEQSALLRDLRSAFLIGLAIALLAILLLGIVSARALRARVNDLNRAFAQVGDQSGKIEFPGYCSEDELGLLARNGSAMAERIIGLIAAHRHVSDQIAHEMRTPLMHLDMRLRQAIAESEDPETLSTLAQSREDIRGVARMLDSLLDIASSEARRSDRSGFESIDLSALVGDLADLFEESGADADIAFEARIAEGVQFDGDRMQLTRMVSNLLDNAFKFTPAGGFVELTLKPGPELRVRDSGPGVPDEDKPRIFDRFVRIGGQTKGHGLGLALVRAIVLRHGLKVEYQDGNPGAEFVISRGAKA